jgi:hypothetical protein
MVDAEMSGKSRVAFESPASQRVKKLASPFSTPLAADSPSVVFGTVRRERFARLITVKESRQTSIAEDMNAKR